MSTTVPASAAPEAPSAAPAAKPSAKAARKPETKAKVAAPAAARAKNPPAKGAEAQKAVSTKAPKAAKAKPEKAKKAKLVRDSFTMPEHEYAEIAALKKRLLALGAAAKKSELLRAGITLLCGLGDAELKKAVQDVEVLKTGRPAKTAA